jgi:hypothetical protein
MTFQDKAKVRISFNGSVWINQPRERRGEFSPALKSRESNIVTPPRVALATIELTLDLLAHASLTRRHLYLVLIPGVKTPG